MPANRNPRTASDGGRPSGRTEDPGEQKARKACLNCRKQKMKCIVGKDDSCRRCHRAGLPCVFVPRSNAATLPQLDLSTTDEQFKKDILRRISLIEARLSLSASEDVCTDVPESADGDSEDDSLNYSALGSFWDTIEVLKKSSPASISPVVWRKSSLSYLWSTFHDRMPGLHFMPDKQTFSSPHPILLASILYCSSMRGPPELAEIAPHYLSLLCNSIAQLSIPGSAIGTPPEESRLAEEWAFQSVLGIVLAGLLTEANVRETGIWFSVAYRLILEHCPSHVDETSREWRKLFGGVQIVDLEHASLHLSCPVIPIEAPLPALRTSHRDQLYRLSRMMHTGLSHFTGRRLPTIWSCFTSNPLPSSSTTANFTALDAAVIRDWARQLDEWLTEFNNSGDGGSEQERQLVFRQYILHRLVVLSIYHPARGCNLWSNKITPREQHELLLSARATLKLHLYDDSIWSNWDLVMITWAALIVIQGVEGNIGEPDDLRNIRIHLEMLKQMNETKPSLCATLISRLEESLHGVNTPDSAVIHGEHIVPAVPNDLDYSWQLFDQISLRHLDYSPITGL